MFWKNEIIKDKNHKPYKVCASHDTEEYVMCADYGFASKEPGLNLYKLYFSEINMNEDQKRRYKEFLIEKRNLKIDKLVK
jgi:hypothetical protein